MTTLSELLDQQEKDISVLSDAIQQLSEKLDPILIDSVPSESSKPGEDISSPGFTVGTSILAYNENIKVLIKRIQSILERVAL